ncbi:MAG: cyclic nucleotide-binding domain-containing protein [Deltaproteobacteria bacterium]|nr:cyclic nucleotide-binding domain-containing protein [Deltaproteobacteria bacterium]
MAGDKFEGAMSVVNRSPAASSGTPGPEHFCAFDADIMGRTPLMAGMPEDCRCVLTDRMEPRTYQDGETVYAEGDAARDLFIVASGNLVVSKRGVALMLLRPADFFGEPSFLDMQPRGNTVRARGLTTVYVIPYSALRSLYQVNMRMYALIVMNLAREISRRLRHADALVAGSTQPPE